MLGINRSHQFLAKKVFQGAVGALALPCRIVRSLGNGEPFARIGTLEKDVVALIRTIASSRFKIR